MPLFESCTEEQKERLSTAFNSYAEFDVFKRDLNHLWVQMQKKWNERLFVCGAGTAKCMGLDGAQDSRRILICNTSIGKIGRILLHELVHDCGGSELDSEAV